MTLQKLLAAIFICSISLSVHAQSLSCEGLLTLGLNPFTAEKDFEARRDTVTVQAKVNLKEILDTKKSPEGFIDRGRLFAEVIEWFKNRQIEIIVSLDVATTDAEVELARNQQAELQSDMARIYGSQDNFQPVLRKFGIDKIRNRTTDGDFLVVQQILGRPVGIIVFTYLTKQHYYLSTKAIFTRFKQITDAFYRGGFSPPDDVALAVMTDFSLTVKPDLSDLRTDKDIFVAFKQAYIEAGQETHEEVNADQAMELIFNKMQNILGNKLWNAKVAITLYKDLSSKTVKLLPAPQSARKTP